MRKSIIRRKSNRPRKSLRTKVCRRCGITFNATGKYSKLCENCKIPSGYYAGKKLKKN